MTIQQIIQTVNEMLDRLMSGDINRNSHASFIKERDALLAEHGFTLCQFNAAYDVWLCEQMEGIINGLNGR